MRDEIFEELDVEGTEFDQESIKKKKIEEEKGRRGKEKIESKDVSVLEEEEGEGSASKIVELKEGRALEGKEGKEEGIEMIVEKKRFLREKNEISEEIEKGRFMEEEKVEGSNFEGKIGQVMDVLGKRGFIGEKDKGGRLEEGKVLTKEEESFKVEDKEVVVGGVESKIKVEGKGRNMKNKEGVMKEKGRVMEKEEGRIEEEEKGGVKKEKNERVKEEEEEKANGGIKKDEEERKMKAKGRVIEDKLGRLQTEGATLQNRKIIHSRTLLKSLSSKNDIKLEEKKGKTKHKIKEDNTSIEATSSLSSSSDQNFNFDLFTNPSVLLNTIFNSNEAFEDKNILDVIIENLVVKYFNEKENNIIKLIDIVILRNNILEALKIVEAKSRNEAKHEENETNLKTLTETSFNQTTFNQTNKFYNKMRESWSSFTKQVLTNLTTETINIDVLLNKMFNVHRFLCFGMFYKLNNKFVKNFERILQQQTSLERPNKQNIANNVKNVLLIKQLRLKTISMFLAKNAYKVVSQNKNYLIFERGRFLRFFEIFVDENGIVNLEFFEQIENLAKERIDENNNKMLNFDENKEEMYLKKFVKKFLNKIERQMDSIKQEKLGR
ncbi:unnamed protein product [Meloidogyne enterolobii]|uniref:Uncharacterized protein n=1 Tax=Meloidogyne enterolobii TaxID=390850 RepID=A0ACB0ZKA6_MELEN